MKLNKKGMTLVELIISVALLSVVLGFMFKLLLDVKYEHDNAGFAIKNQVNRAEIIKTIQNDFENLGLLSYRKENQKIIFYFNKVNEMLQIEDNKITYGDRKWTIADEGYKFGDITVDEINNEYVSIVIPVLNGEEDATDIDDIMLITKYKTIDNPYLKDAVIADAKNNNYLYPSNPMFNSRTQDGEFGVYKMLDDLGISYYFRGDVENNYVKFGSYAPGTTVNGVTYNTEKPMYWRIVRINGDGSVRLIYDGTDRLANGISRVATIGSSPFNNSINAAKYVGYTYDTETDSAVKEVLDDWYDAHLESNYGNYIADEIFCNDREETGYQYLDAFGDETTKENAVSTNVYFSSFTRLYLNDDKSPKLLCPEDYRYTVSNGLLKNPVGLITTDEIVLGGGSSSTNSTYYLYTGSYYWTMSPAMISFINNYPYTWCVGAAGGIVHTCVDSNYGVRPVINLKSDVRVKAGDGSVTSPYELEI